MHLCVVSPFPPDFSGIGQFGWNVTNGLALSGSFRRITVLSGRPETSGGEAPPPAPGISVQPVWARDDERAALHILRALRAARPNVVWFNLGFSAFGRTRPANFLGMAAPLLARQAGFPTVVTLHEIFEVTPPRSVGARNGRVTAWGARAATHMLLQTDAVCVTLESYAAHLRSAYGARNVHHIPHGAFGPPEFLPRPAAAPPEILMLSMFAPHKGLPVLLAAFEYVRRVHPHARLTIAGNDHQRFPGYLAEMRQRVDGAPNIEWRTALSETELREAFARASVVALPYLATTGASSVVHRAAAFGRPLVVSDLPDFRLVAREEGLHLDYVPPADPLALAAALLRVLADPERPAAMAQHNIRMMETMSLEQTSAHYADLLLHVARQTPLAQREKGRG